MKTKKEEFLKKFSAYWAKVQAMSPEEIKDAGVKQVQASEIMSILGITSKQADLLLEMYPFDFLKPYCLTGWEPPELEAIKSADLFDDIDYEEVKPLELPEKE